MGKRQKKQKSGQIDNLEEKKYAYDTGIGEHLDIPTELPTDINPPDDLYFVLYETIALWNTVLNPQQEGMSELIAEQELKELVYLGETILLLVETVSPHQSLQITNLSVFIEEFGRLHRLYHLYKFIELNPTIILPTYLGAESSLQIQPISQKKYSHLQRKIVIIYNTVLVLNYWITFFEKNSIPMKAEIKELKARLYYLLVYLSTFIKTEKSQISHWQYWQELQSIVFLVENIYLPIVNWGKTTRLIYHIAYFLEEAIQDTPTIANLQIWMSGINRYFDDKVPLLVEREIPEEDYRRIIEGMNDVLSLTQGIKQEQNKRELLEVLYRELEKLNSSDILPVGLMRKLGEAIREIPVGELQKRVVNPSMLWQAINKVVTQPAQPGANPLLTLESQALLETFLTTPKSMSELARDSNGLWSVAGVRKNLNTSLQRVWQYIPQQYRQGYQTAQEAMQAVIASSIKTEETRRKMRENERPSWKEDKPRQTGKHSHHSHSQKGITGMRGKVGEHPGGRGKKRESREFSPDHHTLLSEGATRRWQRQREMLQAEAQQNPTIEPAAPHHTGDIIPKALPPAQRPRKT